MGSQDRGQAEPQTSSGGNAQEILDSPVKEREDEKRKEEEQKKKEAEAQGYEVGSDLGFKAFWKDGFNVETANKDFRVHLGGRVHVDGGWFSPSANLNRTFPNQWNDGGEFRRLRVRGDGSMYEVLNWVLEVDFQTSAAGTTNHPVPTDAYLELAHMPVIGSLDVGHYKEPFSFDDYGTPDNYLLLMERSVADNAFGPARNIGLMLHNTALKNKLIWATGIFRTNSDNASGNAFDYGDGEYAYTSRVILMPYYANEGRHWFIFGGAYSRRTFDPDDAGTNGANASRARYAARMPIRVNSPLLVDTTNLVADNADLFNLQTALVLGPFMFQAEFFHTDVHNVRRGAIAAGVPRLVNASLDGFYVQASWVLTGEHHPIDRDRARMNRVRPHTQFFLVDSDGGGWSWGKGAWEIVVRYDYLDLRSAALGDFPAIPGVPGSGAAAIASAGLEQAVTVGLNWYLAPNARFLWNYSHCSRRVANPAASGSADAFGARMIFDF